MVTLKVPVLKNSERLDLYLSQHLQLTRAKIKNLLLSGHLLLNGKKPVKAGVKLKGGEQIEVHSASPLPLDVEPEEIPLDVLYEDEDLLVINKPPGLVVHPAAGHWTGTLVNALLYHFNKLSQVDPCRPGIVHRLDKDTSGVLLVAKKDDIHLALSQQLKNREIEKYYLALVWGKVLVREGIIERPIGRHPRDRKKMAVVPGGRMALTRFRIVELLKNATLLECKLETGRTHQIRVHLASLGHPVLGDMVYGRKGDWPFERQLLHAWRVRLKHPRTGKILSVEAPVPDDFKKALQNLRKELSESSPTSHKI